MPIRLTTTIGQLFAALAVAAAVLTSTSALAVTQLQRDQKAYGDCLATMTERFALSSNMDAVAVVDAADHACTYQRSQVLTAMREAGDADPEQTIEADIGLFRAACVNSVSYIRDRAHTRRDPF